MRLCLIDIGLRARLQGWRGGGSGTAVASLLRPHEGPPITGIGAHEIGGLAPAAHKPRIGRDRVARGSAAHRHAAAAWEW